MEKEYTIQRVETHDGRSAFTVCGLSILDGGWIYYGVDLRELATNLCIMYDFDLGIFIQLLKLEVGREMTASIIEGTIKEQPAPESPIN